MKWNELFDADRIPSFEDIRAYRGWSGVGYAGRSIFRVCKGSLSKDNFFSNGKMADDRGQR